VEHLTQHKNHLKDTHQHVPMESTKLNTRLTWRHPSVHSGELAIDDSTKATAHNDYFCSVSTYDDGCLPIFPKRVDKDIYRYCARIAMASAAFGRLVKRLWNDHGIRLTNKVAA